MRQLFVPGFETFTAGDLNIGLAGDGGIPLVDSAPVVPTGINETEFSGGYNSPNRRRLGRAATAVAAFFTLSTGTAVADAIFEPGVASAITAADCRLSASTTTVNIKEMQSELGLYPDGIVGAKTCTAVINFQTGEGIVDSNGKYGTIGPLTLARIKAASGPSAAPAESTPAAPAPAPATPSRTPGVLYYNGRPAGGNNVPDVSQGDVYITVEGGTLTCKRGLDYGTDACKIDGKSAKFDLSGGVAGHTTFATPEGAPCSGVTECIASQSTSGPKKPASGSGGGISPAQAGSCDPEVNPVLDPSCGADTIKKPGTPWENPLQKAGETVDDAIKNGFDNVIFWGRVF